MEIARTPQAQPCSNESAGTAAPPNEYESTLASLVFPFAGNLLFNGWAATATMLLGHPVIAGAAFALGAGADLVQQGLVRSWLKTAKDVEVGRGMRRVAVLCALRTLASLVPLGVLVMAGGVPELIVAGVSVMALLAIGQTVGGLSRLLFWAYIGPIMAAVATIAIARSPPGATISVAMTLASCFAVLWMLSYNTSRAIKAWRREYDEKIALISELEIARDEAGRANRAKSNFLASMSHEIRTPMNGVLGMAQLLKRDETDPGQADRLDVLIESGEYLLSILNDILDVSKVDAGKLEITPAAEPLEAFLRRALAFWSAKAEECGVALRLTLEDDLPAVVMIDALRMRQILFNLLGNALKFTEQGEVELSIHVVGDTPEAKHLRFSVRDTGPGIDAEHIPFLFDRFSQVDDGEMRRFGGTGLGLSIVQRLTQLMGGAVTVDSQLGVGSTFHVDIPLLISSLDPDAGAKGARGAAPLDALRVLAVDDNDVNLMVLEQLLSSLGLSVVRAGGGQEALATLAVEAFDIVLMDIHMPQMSGIDVVTRLRRAPGPNRDVAVVALTADVMSGGRGHYLDAGFDDHAAKPIQIEDLVGAMSRALARRPAAKGLLVA